MQQRTAFGQILISVVLYLAILSILIVGLTSIAVQSGLQVARNSQYNESYNVSEGTIIEQIQALSNPNIEVSELAEQVVFTKIDSSANCNDVFSSITNIQKYTCQFTNPIEPTNTTVFTFYETSEVTEFKLNTGEYFDLILTPGFSSYIDLSWTAEAAIDLTLFYTKSANLETSTQIIDPHNIMTRNNPQEIMFTGSDISENTARLRFNDDDFNVPGEDLSKINFQRLRIKIFSQNNSLITIKPENLDSLPEQVRVIEAISFPETGVNTSTPIVRTQVPLAPNLPSSTTNASSFGINLDPVCGNNIIEADERCDDGNLIDDDGCTKECCIPLLATSDTWGTGIKLGQKGLEQAYHTPNFPPIQLCHRAKEYTRLTITGELDDILLLIPEDLSVDVDDGEYVQYPENYIMYSPTSGIINPYVENPDGTVGTIKYTDGVHQIYCGVADYCDGNDFKGHGFRVRPFGTDVYLPELLELGLVEIVGQQIVPRFKLVHIAANQGHAIDIVTEFRADDF